MNVREMIIRNILNDLWSCMSSKNLKIEDIADMVNTSPEKLHHWLSGKEYPSGDDLEYIEYYIETGKKLVKTDKEDHHSFHKEAIIDTLNELRDKYKLSFSFLSELIKTNRSNIFNWCSYEKLPNLSQIEKIEKGIIQIALEYSDIKTLIQSLRKSIKKSWTKSLRKSIKKSMDNLVKVNNTKKKLKKISKTQQREISQIGISQQYVSYLENNNIKRYSNKCYKLIEYICDTLKLKGNYEMKYKDTQKQSISIQLSQSQLKKIDRMAKEKGFSRSYIINSILKDYLQKFDKNENKVKITEKLQKSTQKKEQREQKRQDT